MSYQQELAALRQKYQMESFLENASPQLQQAAEQQAEYEEVNPVEQEVALHRQWAIDAGMNPVFESQADLNSEEGRHAIKKYEEEMSKNPVFQKYGPQLRDAVMQLRSEVENPNSPMNLEQAQQTFRELVMKAQEDYANGGK